MSGRGRAARTPHYYAIFSRLDSTRLGSHLLGEFEVPVELSLASDPGGQHQQHRGRKHPRPSHGSCCRSFLPLHSRRAAHHCDVGERRRRDTCEDDTPRRRRERAPFSRAPGIRAHLKERLTERNAVRRGGIRERERKHAARWSDQLCGVCVRAPCD